jgi:hypothetical protein
VSRQVWRLHISPRDCRRLGSLEGAHIKGVEFCVGIGIEDVGVMVEYGGKIGMVKMTWRGFLGRPRARCSVVDIEVRRISLVCVYDVDGIVKLEIEYDVDAWDMKGYRPERGSKSYWGS